MSLENLPQISEGVLFETCVDMFGAILSEPCPEPSPDKKPWQLDARGWWKFAKHYVEGAGFSVEDIVKAYRERLEIGRSEWQ